MKIDWGTAFGVVLILLVISFVGSTYWATYEIGASNNHFKYWKEGYDKGLEVCHEK